MKLPDQTVSLSAANLILPVGARVRVVGLSSAASQQWSGRIGEVVNFDRSALRYEVLMSDTQTLRIKLENVLL